MDECRLNFMLSFEERMVFEHLFFAIFGRTRHEYPCDDYPNPLSGNLAMMKGVPPDE